MLIDALCQITGTTEKYSSPIPEPFTFIPEDQRSIALPDGSITSPFLEMFGRPPRDTGLESERQQPPHGRPAVAPAEFQLTSGGRSSRAPSFRRVLPRPSANRARSPTSST